MSYTRARAVKIVVFLGLFVLVDWAIEQAGLRPRLITLLVDSIALTTGLSSQVVENLLVGLMAYLLFQFVLVLTGSLRFLTGEPRREVRASDELTHEHGAANR